MKFRPSFYSYIQKTEPQIHSTLKDSDNGKHTHNASALNCVHLEMECGNAVYSGGP